MKLLAIIGSARKKETYHAVQKLETLIAAQQEVDFEYLFLQEHKLSDCIGCHNCIARGENLCPEAKKIRVIKEKMEAADVIILASPVYNDHVTALMKKWFDYMTYLWHRPEFFGKRFVLMSSGGGMFKALFKYMEKNVKSWGGQVIGSCGVPHYESLTPAFRKKATKSIEELAKKVVALETTEKLPVPTIGQLMWFSMWKLNAKVASEDYPKDQAFWAEHNWFDMDYYYKTRINPLKKWLIKRLTFVMHYFMRKVYVGY